MPDIAPNIEIGTLKTASLAGWGISNVSGNKISKFFSELTIGACRLVFNFDSDAHICTIGDNSSKCIGLPGVPLTITKEGDPVLIGIAHFVYENDCISQNPTVFTSVQNSIEWILSKVCVE